MIQSKLVYLERKVKELQSELEKYHSELNTIKLLVATVFPIITTSKTQEYSRKVEEIDKFIRMVSLYLDDFKKLTDEGLDVRNESFMRMTKSLRMMGNLANRLKEIYNGFSHKSTGKDVLSFKECRKQIDEYNVHYSILKREQQIAINIQEQ